MRLSPEDEARLQADHFKKVIGEFERREAKLAKLLRTARGGRPKKRRKRG